MLVRELGADVGAKDKYGEAPLHCAANQHSRMVSVLAEELGADVHATEAGTDASSCGSGKRCIARGYHECCVCAGRAH